MQDKELNSWQISSRISSAASQAEAATTTGNGAPKVEPIHVTDADFEALILKSDKPAIVDLWAEWCGPCHMMPRR